MKWSFYGKQCYELKNNKIKKKLLRKKHDFIFTKQ